jgi:hypothetical protein
MMFESGHCGVTPYGNGILHGYRGRFGGGGRGDHSVNGNGHGDGGGYGLLQGDGIGMPHMFQKSENPYCTCTYGDMRYFICQQTMVGL